MKKKILNAYFIFAAIFLLSFICSVTPAFSQDDENVVNKYLKDKYEETYDAPFDKIWSIVQTIVTDEGCQIVSDRVRELDDGMRKGICQSELCILSQKADTVFIYMKNFALKPPFIRGGVWDVFRCQSRFVVTEIDKNKTKVLITLDMSSFESNATKKSYNFDTNGYREFLLFEKINELSTK
ncbi:MAG: hypothetical protein LBO69_06410 [Ignavibacteria bacterium]|jgi:hypothetical protein|nr:hypothetical protein [Ignavibacteria bacterium]